MRKLFTICIFIATTFTISAQTLKGSCYDSGQGTSSWFTQVDLNATFSFYAKNNLVYIRCSNLRMNVPSNTTYNAYGETYTKSDLGISQWPQNQKPWSMTINIDGSYSGGSFSKSISCSGNYICDEFHIEGIKVENVNISSFKVNSISNFTYNQGGDPQLEELIKQKNKQESQKTNSSVASTQNSGSTNPLETNSTTVTTSQIPSLESQYAKLGIPANTPIYTKQDLTNQLVTQAGSLGAELLNIWAANQEIREARLNAEYKAKIHAEYDVKRRKQKTKFITEFLPLLKQAENGNVNARMILCFASRELSCEEFVPNKESWIEQAFADNNKDAIMYQKGYDNEYLEKNRMSLSNVDAMVKLAMWYSHKTNIKGLSGGGNEQKALEWFNKAADAGSPNAMYFLGMIYKYGQVVSDKYQQNLFIKFTLTKDEKLALDWFIKAEQPDYKESIYSRMMSSNEPFLATTSFYIPTRYQRYLLYKKGKTVRDKAKAEEMKSLMDRNSDKERDNYEKANEKFGNIDRY